MTNSTEKKPSWVTIGSSTTSPTSNTERKEVKVDDYYVVVGFEVNNSEAFKPATVINGKYIPDVITVGNVTTLVHDLAVDYGHAFFYVVKNDNVSKIFSFGPKGAGKVGWFGAGASGTDAPNKYNTGAVIKDGYKNARPGTADYNVTEKITAFKIPLSLRQGVALETATDIERERITSGKQKYAAYVNDTCAEAARDVLSSAGVDTPSGSGWVKHTGVASFPLVYAVNPYMWNHRFKSDGKFESKPVDYYFSPAQSVNPALLIGSADPVF